MRIIKYIIDFLFSLRTTLWLLGIMLVFLLAGAFVMPGRTEFQELHSLPLFEWIQKQPLQLTWWLWGIIGILAVMTLNTLFCSIESIVKKRKVTQWLLLISPQIIHMGFLFILLAHLLSGVGAYQQAAVAREGTALKLSGTDTVMQVKDISIHLDYYGRIKDWAVRIEYRTGDQTLHEDTIRPNQPSTYTGLNVNVKNLKPYPETVLLQLNREPGAVWALVGGVLFMFGIVSLIGLKIKMER
jgi:hypothetical protein